MSESALGLRHGPMAAMDAETLFVCFLSGDKRVQSYERDLLREIGAKKISKRRVVVSGNEFTPDSFAEQYLAPASVSGIPDEYRAPVDVMFGQTLGLFSSLGRSLQPDNPSPDGVISRVVHSVSIHS
jgi:tagatose-6-phosphate ketose/aldose isomerase